MANLKYLLFLLILNQVICVVEFGSELVCPLLTCSLQQREDEKCFSYTVHDNATVLIEMYPCPEGKICDIDFHDPKIAWSNSTEIYQGYQGDFDYTIGPSYKKKTYAYCVASDKFKREMMPGRQCLSDFECYSRNCKLGICRGKLGGSSCAKHEECDVGLACRHQNMWPYTTYCLEQLNEGEECVEDEDCQFGFSCWYPSEQHALNKTKECMPAYGLRDGEQFGWLETVHFNMDYENFRVNGKVCQSMLAVQVDAFIAECASFQDTDGEECEPFKNRSSSWFQKLCTYTFDTTKRKVEDHAYCNCGVNGTNSGVCPYANMTVHREYSEAIRELQKNMAFCHTKDRENMVAFADCGDFGIEHQFWRQAVEYKLQLKYYNAFQEEASQNCALNFHPMSVNNIARTFYNYDDVTAMVSRALLKKWMITLVAAIWVTL